MTTKTVFITTAGSSSWTVPSDFTSTNSIFTIGGGGGAGGTQSSVTYGGGGGGGGFSSITNISLTPGASVTVQVGAAGTHGAPGSSGTAGGDTWFNGASLAASSVGAKGGGGGGAAVPVAGGAGGASASGIGTTKFSGGSGSPLSASNINGAGGGAGGPSGTGGAGGTGGTDTGSEGGVGGGGADGGSAGSNFTLLVGGNGGNNAASAGGGAGGNASVGANGTVGGGGGGGAGAASGSAFAGGNGGSEALWTQTSDSATAGPGGGGGAAGVNAASTTNNETGGGGAIYGGGGGAAGYATSGHDAAGGDGAQGIIVVQYTASTGSVGTVGISVAVAGVSASSTIIAPNNAAIIYSPSNWFVSSGSAITVNGGAYFSTMFTGTSCVLNFDVSAMASPASQIWWRVDNNVWVQATVAATVTPTIPTINQGNADVPYHLLEVVVKSTSITSSNWNPGTTSVAVKLTSITLDGSATVTAPQSLAKTMLVFGDSVPNGYNANGEADATDTNRTDAMQSSLWLQGRKLGAEIGLICFDGQGYVVTGVGSVPNLASSYNLIYQGQSRTWGTPNLIVIANMGANDWNNSASTTTVTTNATTALTGMLGATSTTNIVVLAPFSSQVTSAYRTAIQSAVTAVASTRCVYVDPTGVFNTVWGSTADGFHPSGPNHQGKMADAVAAILSPYLYPSSGGTAGMLYVPNMDGT